jgi:hypothetical protein
MEICNRIVPTPVRLDVAAMIKATNDILSIHKFSQKWQVCLTHRPSVTDPLERAYEGCGHVTSLQDEFEFSEPNEAFKGTYFYEVLHSMKKNYRVGRSRLMLLPAGRCYTMHRDNTAFRYHAAVLTNPYCFMTYGTGEMHHIPADGNIYRMQVRPLHSAFNAGKTDRIHFLFEFAEK